MCSSVYDRLVTSLPSPREAVYIPSESSPRQEKKQPKPIEHAIPDGVESRLYLEALTKECTEATYR